MRIVLRRSCVPSSNKIDPTAYAAAVEAAAHQFDYGTDGIVMVDAADALRAVDPAHPLVAALETRIRQAFEFKFALLRTKVTGRLAKGD
jgi:hypothetical protein